MLRWGEEYGERSGSGSNSPARSPRPVETTTSSWVRASSSRSSMPALRTTTLPPRRSISARRAGIFRRRSTECAGCSSGTVNAVCVPSSRRTSYSIRRSAGEGGSRAVTPSMVSTSSADSNVIWLDMTGPDRISSALRPETSVTGRPCWRRPSASIVPAGPAPTIAMAGRVMPSSLSSASTQRGRHRGPGGRGRVDDGEVVGALEDPEVDEGVGRDEPLRDRQRHDVVVGAVHDADLAARAVAEANGRVGLVVPLRNLLRLTAEQRLGRPVAESLPGSGSQVADGREADHTLDLVRLVGQPQREVAARRVPYDGQAGRRDSDPFEQPGDRVDRRVDVVRRRRPPASTADPSVLRRRDHEPLRRESRSHRTRVPPVVGLLPESPVQEYDERGGPRARQRQVYVDQPVVVGRVADDRVGEGQV